MKATCPNCGAILKIPDGYNRPQVKCQTCKTTFDVGGSEGQYAEQDKTAAFAILAISLLIGCFILGNVSGYFIGRTGPQAEAEDAKAEVRRLSRKIDKQAQQQSQTEYTPPAQPVAVKNKPAYRAETRKKTTVRKHTSDTIDPPRVGEKGVLYNGAEYVAAARSKQSLNELYDAISANDDIGKANRLSW